MELRSSLASRATLLLVLVFGSAVLSGCGQKGPLTLEIPSPKPPAGPASAPTK